jgi:hypothetical protein
MTRRFFGFLGALAGLALVSGSCVEDPLSGLDGTPVGVVFDRGLVVLAIGEVDTVTATVVDGRSTPLALPISYTACDGGAISVTTDTSYHPVPNTSVRFIVRAIASGPSCVATAAGGVRDTLSAGVLPVNFGGTASSTTLNTGDTLTLQATASLKFDTATANVNFGGGFHGTVVSRTANTLRVIVPIPPGAQPAAITIENVDVTYVPNLRANLTTAAAFTITNPHEPNDAPLPATAVTIPDTLFEGFLGGEADNFYTLTLAAPTTFTVTMDWEGTADLDILFCNAACSALVGSTAGATGANPETVTVTLPAGSYNLYINNFVDPPTAPLPAVPLYRIRITP